MHERGTPVSGLNTALLFRRRKMRRREKIRTGGRRMMTRRIRGPWKMARRSRRRREMTARESYYDSYSIARLLFNCTCSMTLTPIQTSTCTGGR